MKRNFRSTQQEDSGVDVDAEAECGCVSVGTSLCVQHCLFFFFFLKQKIIRYDK